MEVYGYIYLLKNNINNKLYIGQTINGFDSRYRNNVEKETKNKHLKYAFNKYGIENFTIIKEFDKASSKEELDALEDMYIKIYSTYKSEFGYNKRFGGSRGKHTEETKEKNRQAHLGKEVSIDTRKKLSEANSGKNNPMYGIPSPMTGKKHSEETKHKLSEMNKNRVFTEETKQKMSENHADVSGSKNPRAKAIICITTEEEFSTVREASKKYNCDESTIVKCCKGKKKSCGKHPITKEKLLWKYKDGDNNE